MKKTIFYLLSFSFIIFLASCGGNESKKETTSKEIKKEIIKKEVVKKAEFDLAASVKAGEAVYSGKGNCATCHMANGQGVAKTFPPLAASDYLLNNPKNAIKVVVKGLNETITVNGTEYKQVMPPHVGLTDEEVRDVVNFILNSWENKGGQVSLEDVKAAK